MEDISNLNKDLFRRIQENKDVIDEQRPFDDPHMLRQIQKFYRAALTYSSNALEGNSYTLSETAIVLEDGLTVGGKTIRETSEVIGHGKAYDYMFSLLRNGVLSIENIMELHRLFYSGIDETNAGKLRNVKVFITGSEYVPPFPEKLPQELKKLESWMKSAGALSLDPIVFAAELHRKLVTIHPFIDGNGRTARLAMNVILIQRGYIPVIIPPILRNEYITILSMSQTKGTQKEGREKFINFIAAQVYESLKDYIRMLG
jgi:Fic family protein